MRRSFKDILIGYVGTLTDRECQDVYYAINDMRLHKVDWVEIGNVKLSRGQYSKLMDWWGKDKFDKCVEILDEWLSNTELRFKFASHYKMMLGWVDSKYHKLYGEDKTVRFSSENIDTAWKAKKYIKHIPEELRAYDSEVKLLVERFGTEILK